MLLHDAFDFHARVRGEAPFARYEGRSYSYAEAQAASVRLAAALAHAGIGHGDRICLLQRNSPAILLAIFAASRIGAVIVPLNYRLAPREWIDLTADAETAAFIADPDFAAQFDEALREYPLSFDVLKICVGAREGWSPFDEFINFPEERSHQRLPVADDIIFQMYTSGTTGRSKGVLLSQRGLVENIFKFSFAVPSRLNPGENTLVALPLFHIAAFSPAICAIAQGACLVIHRDVDPTAIINSLLEDEIVVANFVPAVIQLLLNGVPGIDKLRFSKLRYLAYGGSPIAENVLRRAIEVFKCDFTQGYGMTEIGGAATLLSEADHRRALDGEPDLLLSAGKPLGGTEIRIIAADGQRAPVEAIGEILIRSDELFAGYWKQPEATAAALAGGWLHTGDAGYLDGEGYLYIRDRMKDMIVSGAENIYPVEIESVLFDHAAVADAAVIGVPDERWGETVMAVVVVREGKATSVEDLDRHCRNRLGGFKVPKLYEFVKILPRNATGKVLKTDLRKIYWKDHKRMIG